MESDPHIPRRATRHYDLGDAEDLAKLQVLRKSMLTRTSRAIAETFDELRFNFRIGRREIRRLCGPGIISNRTRAARQSNFQHDVALGLVRMRRAIVSGQVGEWVMRVDGTRSNLRLTDVPDMYFNAPTDWLQVIEFVVSVGWSYAALGELVGASRSQISKLSWGRQSPRMYLGESVLWGARLIRGDTVTPPARSDMALRQPALRIVEDAERARPWWFPAPIVETPVP